MNAESKPGDDSAQGAADRLRIAPAAPTEIMRSVALGEMATALPRLISVAGDGRTTDLSERSGVLILAFLGDACPAVKACIESLVALQQRLGERGVHVIGVNSNNQYLSPTDTPSEMARWATERNLNFPYLKDPQGELARRLGVTNTPHFLVLDPEKRLRYRGRMYDSREPARATTRDLEDAVDCVLDDRPVTVPETHPLGCAIVW